MTRSRTTKLGLAGLVALNACADIQHTTDYVSTVRHEPLPLRTTVTVLVTPELRKDMEDDPARLDGLRRMYQEALRRDLLANGPMLPVTEQPEARLLITLREINSREPIKPVMFWMLSPFWLLGAPYYYAWVELRAEAVLTSAWGDILYRDDYRFRCKRVEGLYYGHDDLSFGCPAMKIAEQMRERISMNRVDILAQVDRRRAKLLASTRVERKPRFDLNRDLKPAPKPRATRARASKKAMPTAAVFTIRDMSGQFNARVLDQLTEYLSARVASQLNFKVVPREAIRLRLAQSKQDTYRACYDESCQIEVGKALAASKTVSTTLLRVGSRCAFTSTVFDLRTEAADNASSVQTSCDEDALLDGVDRVVKGFTIGHE